MYLLKGAPYTITQMDAPKKSMCDCPPFDICFCDNKNVSIDRAIGEPGHGKYLVDGLNSCDKQHLKR